MQFEQWLKQLDETARERGYCVERGQTYSAVTGADCWRDYFDDGLLPADALAEDELAGIN